MYNICERREGCWEPWMSIHVFEKSFSPGCDRVYLLSPLMTLMTPPPTNNNSSARIDTYSISTAILQR